MRILRIYNDDQGVDIRYKTDLISKTQSNFTVLSVNGLDEAEKKLGISFKQMPYRLESFKKFCSDNGFGLSATTVGPGKPQSEEVLIEQVLPDPDPEG